MPDPMTEAEAVDLATAFKALAEPSRLQLLALITVRPGEHAARLDGDLPLLGGGVARHLRILRGAGLLVTDRVGRKHRVTVDESALAEVAETLRGLTR